jgi:hypothetical protein
VQRAGKLDGSSSILRSCADRDDSLIPLDLACSAIAACNIEAAPNRLQRELAYSTLRR